MKAFYRPHKMALWNLLVPDLVKLAEREMDVAIDKLPHSRFPSATSAGGNVDTNDMNVEGDDNEGDSKTTTFTYGGIDVSEGIPVSVVIIIGIILLSLNVCACVGVIYQKSRVRQREDNLRRHIHRLSDAGVIHSASVLADDDAIENTATGGGPYCISTSDNFNQNTYGPDPVKNNGCTAIDPEDLSDSEDEEQIADDDLYMMKQRHSSGTASRPGQHSLPHQHQHQSISNQQKVGSLKSALRKPTKSSEMLFQSLPDRSELHRHSKSIPNFDQTHDLMNRDNEGINPGQQHRNTETYLRGMYYNYPSQQQPQSHYNVPRSIYSNLPAAHPQMRQQLIHPQYNVNHPQQPQQHYQQTSPYGIPSSSNHDSSFSSNRSSLFAGSINSTSSGVPTDTLRSRSSATINLSPATRNQEMKMYHPPSNAMSGHFSDSATDGSLSIRQQHN